MFAALFAVMPVAAADGFGTPDKDYNEHKYDEAIKGYREIIANDGASAQLYYNLANAYYMKNEYGEAMLFYKRAYKLDPGNNEILNNMDFLASKIADINRSNQNGEIMSVDPDERTFFDALNLHISHDYSSNYWGVFALVSFWLAMGGVALYFFASNVMMRKVGFFGSMIFMLFTIVFCIFMFMSVRVFKSQDEAVVKAYQVELREKADTTSAAAAPKLSRGTVVDIISEEIGSNGRPAWYKVRLNHNYVGWVKPEEIEVI